MTEQCQKLREGLSILDGKARPACADGRGCQQLGLNVSAERRAIRLDEEARPFVRR
jgi:hypothetical protein